MMRSPRDPRTAAIIARIREDGDGRAAGAVDSLCLDWLEESEGSLRDEAVGDLECLLDAVVADARRNKVVAFVRVSTYFENMGEAGRETLSGAFERAFQHTSDFTTLYFVAETLGRKLSATQVVSWIDRAALDPRDHAREAVVRACASALTGRELPAEAVRPLRAALGRLAQDSSADVRAEAKLQLRKLTSEP